MAATRHAIVALALLAGACHGPDRAASQTLRAVVHHWELPSGSRIAYARVAGARGRELPPIIYLHGGPGAYEVASLPAYRPFAEAWAALGFDVYFYDQVGSGLSGRLRDPTAYTVARQVADLDLIRARIGARRVVLVGESWGATLAAHFIAAHPAAVVRAVFVSPGVIDLADWEARRASPRFDPALLAWVRSHRSAAEYRRCVGLDSLIRTDVRAAYARAGDAPMDSLLNAWASAEALAKAVADPSRIRAVRMHGMGFWAWTMTNWDLLAHAPRVRRLLRRFDRPVLILHGTSDYLPAAIAAQYAATFPRSTLVEVPGAGHLIWVDRPEIFGREVARFLKPLADRVPG